MKILLIGFKKYASHDCNPSELAISKVNRAEYKPIILDATFDAVLGLPDIIEKEKPDYIVATNLSPFAKEPAVEEYAYNEIDSVQPDEKGIVKRGVPVVEGAPASINSVLDVPSIQNFLASRGNGCAISIDPGRWIDNAAFYLCRHSGVPTIAMHFPLPSVTPIEDDVEILESLVEYFEAMN